MALTSGRLRVEVAGTDRTLDTRVAGLSITRRVKSVGTCALLLQSKTGAWRPGLMDALEIWHPVRRVTDAAITSGDKTLTSATADFVAGDVGAHVRIADAAGSSRPRYATVASRTSSTEVEIDENAGATVSGKELLVGTCRFRGYVNTFRETRIGTAASSREWAVDAVDLQAALGRIYMPTDYSTDYTSRTEWAQITHMLAATVADTHGIGAVMTGGASRTWTDITPQSLFDAVEFVIASSIGLDGADRWWGVDTLGRIVAYEMDGYAYTGNDLTTANANIVLRPARGSKTGNEYFNRIAVTGYTRQFVGGNYRTHGVTYDNATEQSALGGRVFEAASRDVRNDPVAPSGNDPAWIDLDADLTTYATQLQSAVGRDAWTLDIVTFQDGIAPGMIVTVDVSELGISSVDHFVQEVTLTGVPIPDATGVPLCGWRQQLQANGQLVLYTTPWDRWQAWRP